VLDGQTWESWIRRNLRTKAGRAYFHVACEAVWAAEASDVSLLHALFYAHSNAGLETLIAVDRGAQQDRVAGGSVRAWRAPSAAAKPPRRRSLRCDSPWLPSNVSHDITLTLCGIGPTGRDPSANSRGWPSAPDHPHLRATAPVPWLSSGPHGSTVPLTGRGSPVFGPGIHFWENSGAPGFRIEHVFDTIGSVIHPTAEDALATHRAGAIVSAGWPWAARWPDGTFHGARPGTAALFGTAR